MGYIRLFQYSSIFSYWRSALMMEKMDERCARYCLHFFLSLFVLLIRDWRAFASIVHLPKSSPITCASIILYIPRLK